MKTETPSPTFTNNAEQTAYAQGEIAAFQLLKGLDAPTALNKIEEIILEYVNRGHWSTILKLSPTRDIKGLIKIWRDSLEEVFPNRSLEKTNRVLAFLTSLIDDTPIHENHEAEFKVKTIQFVSQKVFYETIGRLGTELPFKDSWLTLLDLMEKESTIFKVFEEDWKNINRINACTLMGYMGEKVSTWFSETQRTKVIKHLWRAITLAPGIRDSQLVAYADILSQTFAYCTHSFPGCSPDAAGTPTEAHLFKRCSAAVQKATEEVMLLFELASFLKKPNSSCVEFARFEIDDDTGKICEIKFTHKWRNSDLWRQSHPKQKGALTRDFRNVVGQIRNWCKDRDLNLTGTQVSISVQMRDANHVVFPFDSKIVL